MSKRDEMAFDVWFESEKSKAYHCCDQCGQKFSNSEVNIKRGWNAALRESDEVKAIEKSAHDKLTKELTVFERTSKAWFERAEKEHNIAKSLERANYRLEQENKKLRDQLAMAKDALQYLSDKASMEEWRVGDDETEPMMTVDEYCEKALTKLSTEPKKEGVR